MLKLLGALLLVAATSGIGFRMAAGYRDRPRHIRQLQRALSYLQAQIEYQATPLPTALLHVAERTEPPCQALFQNTAERLGRTGHDVSEAFALSLAELESESALGHAEVEAVQALASALSSMDANHLQTQFELTSETLRNAELEAREQGLKTARLWQYLGVLTGVMLVILLY